MKSSAPQQIQTAAGQHDLIKTAWKAGKRSIEIDGIKFVLIKQTKKVAYHESGQTKKRLDTNIIAKRADGEMLPRYNTNVYRKELS